MKVNEIVDTHFDGDIRSQALDQASGQGVRQVRVTEQRPAPAPGRERFVVVDRALPPLHSRFASGCSPGVVCAQPSVPDVPTAKGSGDDDRARHRGHRGARGNGAAVGDGQFGRGSGATQKHVHSVIRTPDGNDYGRELLRQHYLTSPRHR
jgi:hypothetical protein